MKIFGLITFLTVLASCGGGGGSSSNVIKSIDPITADKFEQSIRSQKAGMVKNDTEKGNYVDLDYNEARRNFDISIKDMNSNSRDTILKIDGDTIYTLQEEFEDGKAEATRRSVKMESMDQLVKDITEPLPPGTSLSMNGNKMSLKFKFSYTNDFTIDGVSAKQTMNTTAVASIDLTNIRCSQTSVMSTASVLIINGNTQNLPTTGANTASACGATLTRAQLKAIPLTNLELCDETSGDDEAEVKCNAAADLSYLVN